MSKNTADNVEFKVFGDAEMKNDTMSVPKGSEVRIG